jgi:hypothetical protein
MWTTTVAKRATADSGWKQAWQSTWGVHVRQLMVRVQFTNQAIENLVTASDLPSKLFVIVGDHAPPLMNLSDREQWDQEHVPWVVLKPKMLSSHHESAEPKL